MVVRWLLNEKAHRKFRFAVGLCCSKQGSDLQGGEALAAIAREAANAFF